MTCNHFDQIVNKLVNLTEKITNVNSSLYERQGPYMNWRDIERCLGRVNTNINFGDPVASITALQNLVREITGVDAFTLNTVKGRMIADYVVEMLNLIKQCNCSSNLGSKVNDLCNDYNGLLGDYNNLQDRYNNLSNRFNDTNTKYEEYKEKYEDTRNERENERVNNTRTITALQRDNSSLRNELNNTQQLLTASENKVARIENELRTKDNEIIELKHKMDNLSLSEEELLNEKVRLKKEKLEVFANSSGINWNEVNNLLRYYKDLISARKNYDQTNIETQEGNINRVKGVLRQNEINLEDIQKCCRKCEKIAKLSLKLSEAQRQQFEARQQEVNPPRQH